MNTTYLASIRKALVALAGPAIGMLTIFIVQQAAAYGYVVNEWLAGGVATVLVSLAFGFLVWWIPNLPPGLIENIGEMYSGTTNHPQSPESRQIE